MNTFDNNANAIKASNGGIVIQNNTIKIPTIPTYAATGITLAGAAGYNVTSNTLTNCSTCGSSYGDLGMVVNDGHTENEIIKNNTFDYVRSATIALQNNGNGASSGTNGLQFLCNTYNNSWAGISRYSSIAGSATTVPGTINNNQGSCSYSGTTLIPTSPAGNQFYMPCDYVTAKLDVNDATVSQVVTYNNNYESSGTFASLYDPAPCYNSALYVDNGCLSGGGTGYPLFSTACPVPAVIGPTSGGCPTCAPNINPAGTGSAIGALDAAMAGTTAPAALAAMQAQHDGLVNDLALYYALTASYDSAAALLAYYSRYRDALPYYVAAGDYTDAATMYAALPLATADDKLYAWEAGLMLNLYSEGQTWFDLDTASADSMTKIAQYNSPAGYMAGGITALLGLAPVTWPAPVLDTAMIDSVMTLLDTNQNASRTAHGGPVAPANSSSAATFSVFPNPNYGNLTATATCSGAFYLYTIEGRPIATYTIGKGSTDLQMPAALASGLYMGVFKPDSGGAGSTIRLVYEPQK